MGGGSTWEQDREEETSFGGKTHESEIFKEERVKELYQILPNKTHQRLEPRLDMFEIGKDGGLYYEEKSLMKRDGELRETGVLADRLGITRLCEMDFIISRTNLKPRHVLDLMEKKLELTSASDVANADEMELEKIMENAVKSTEDLIVQFETALQGQAQFEKTLPMHEHELLGLDKQLRNIWGPLKLEVAKKGSVRTTHREGKRKLEEIHKMPDYTDVQREEIQKQITELNDDLKTRQESIDILKGRLTNQITSSRGTIAKVLDRDT